MKLFEHLREQTVCVNLAARHKDAAIEELAALLEDAQAVNDFVGFKNAVLSREKEHTTGVGNLVAVPHARTNAVDDFVVAVGVSKKGVEFDSDDGKPVNLIVLLGIPTHMIKVYLKLLAHLSVLFRQEGFVERLQAAECASDIIETFAAYEK